MAKKIVMISIDQGELEQIVFAAISRALKLNRIAFFEEEKINTHSDHSKKKSLNQLTKEKEAVNG